MNATIILGASSLDLLVAKTSVDHALGVALAAHESMYRGGDYFRFDQADTVIRLQRNFMEDDGEVSELRCPNAKLLLYFEAEAGKAIRLASLVTAHLPEFKLHVEQSWRSRREPRVQVGC